MATQHDPASTDEQMFHMPESAYERLLAEADIHRTSDMP